MLGCVVNIDTGGTFTDGFLVWNGEARGVKTLTTPHDLTVCFVACLTEGAKAYGVPLETLLRDTELIRFSTTFGTNALLQRSGPKLGLLVTDGHAQDLYAGPDEATALNFLIDAEMIREVDTAAPARREVLAAVQDLIDAGARGVVVCLAGSHADPTPERQIREWVEAAFPQHFLGTPQLFLAGELSDRPGDAVRLTTALINAYIHRDMARSLYRAEEQARRRGYRHPLLVAHASGGCARVAKTKALHTLSSGPAGGVAGLNFLRQAYGFGRVVGVDMGGTSVDLAALDGAELPMESEPLVHGLRVHQPMITVRSIGAGGGSIARVRNGRLSVGPESAGAAPGPACFDLGGTLPTVTDADLVLGYLDPTFFLGGRTLLNPQRAEVAIRTYVADPLGLSVTEAALAIRSRVHQDVGEAIRGLMADAGDARPDALFCFGGGGPTHGADFAGGVGITRLITSPYSAVFSAFGLSRLDITHSYAWVPGQTAGGDDFFIDDEKWEQQMTALRERAVRDMRGEGFSAQDIIWRTEIRLAANGAEKRFVLLGDDPQRHDLSGLYAEARTQWQLDPEACVRVAGVTVLAGASARRFELKPAALGPADAAAARKGTRRAIWPRDFSRPVAATDTSVYDRARLAPGHLIHGPALVESIDSTCVVPPGWIYRVDPYLNGVLEVAAS